MSLEVPYIGAIIQFWRAVGIELCVHTKKPAILHLYYKSMIDSGVSQHWK